MIEQRIDDLNDRQGHGVEGLLAAIAVQAVEDLSDTRRHVREDAAMFFHDGRFNFIAYSLPGINPVAAREKLRNRGLLP